ncbi:MAG: hypothetical protein GKS07_07895 [Nitrosopumilus sp.]|nr:MAG: hypothetical protein GKS07_07895 [Nitrosopumilus sp.]
MEYSRDKLRNLKNSCWGIGLSDIRNKMNFMISGTGFAIDSEGFILTASHVIKELDKQREKLRKENIECAVSAFQVTMPEKQGHPLILKRGLVERRHIKITPTEKHPLPSDYDVVVCRMAGKYDLKDYLKIKKPCKLELFEEILCCGFPGGSMGVFNIEDLESGLRLSPAVQSGKISSVMPIDDVINPTGIITDIVGIGGSSGSPIVNSNDNEVIGIAQKVIPTEILKNGKSIGEAKIGLILGISNYVLSKSIDKIIPLMKNELDENGKLKQEFAQKYSSDNTEKFTMDMS